MQAHGHENIENIVGSYLHHLLQRKHSNISNGIKSVCDTEQDFINLLYLGNWVTDMSQLLVPDFFYAVRKNLNVKIDSYNTTLDGISPFVGSKLELHFNEIFDNQLLKILSNLPSFIPGLPLLSIPVEKLKEAVQAQATTIITQLKQNKCKPFNDYINQYKLDKTVVASFIGTNAKKFDYTDTADPLWDIAQAIVKVFGYKKYCIGASKMSFENFEAALSIFIESNKPKQESTSQFKLLQYYPSDHLDRPFDANIANEKELKPKQTYIDKRLNKGKQDKTYDYLLEYRDILAGKFTAIQTQMIKKYIAGDRPMSNTDVLTLLPQLGTSLHMLEDFYAHSNFYELALLKLDSKNLSEPFTPFLDFLAIDNKADDKRIANSGNTLSVSGGIIDEPNIVTGFFVDEDTKVSLLHILENSVELYVDKLDIEPIMEAHRMFTKKREPNDVMAEAPDAERETPQIDTDAVDAIANFIEGLGNMIKKYPTSNSTLQAKINEFTPTQINEEQFDFFTGDYYKNANRVLSPEAKQQTIYIINSVLTALYAGKILKTALQIKDKYEQIKLVYEFIKIVFYIITAERQVVRIVSKVLFLILDIVLLALPLFARKKIYSTINEKLKHFILDRSRDYMNWLKKELGIDQISTLGGHAILAKDEQVDKKVTYDIVTKMAVFADTYMLDNMFRNYSIKKSGIEVADLKQDLIFLMHNPCLIGGATNMVYDESEKWHIKYYDFYTSRKLKTTSLKWVYGMYREGINESRFTSEEAIFKKFIYENRNLHIPTFEHFRIEMLIQFMDYTIWDLLDNGNQRQILRTESFKKRKPLLSIVFPFQKYPGRESMDSPFASPPSKTKKIETKVLNDVVIEVGLDWSCYFFRKDKLADIKNQLQESQDKIVALDIISVLGDAVTMNEFIKETIGADEANTTVTPSSDEKDYYSYFYNVYSQNKSSLIPITEAQAIIKKAVITERLAKEKYIKFINEYVQKSM